MTERTTASVALTGPRRGTLLPDDRLRRDAPPRPAGSDPASPSTPVILPPASVDEELAAEAARIRAQVAAARRKIDPSAFAEPTPDPDPDPEGRRVVAADADVDAAPEAPADRRAAHGARPAPEPEAGPETSAPEQSVAEVAASVIAAMQAVGQANERHLEAVALETARHYELMTAQAELDAELIRLHARREAHAIIAAARRRAGADAPSAQAEALHEIGETFSRFAENVESSIGLGTAPPDPTQLPVRAPALAALLGACLLLGACSIEDLEPRPSAAGATSIDLRDEASRETSDTSGAEAGTGATAPGPDPGGAGLVGTRPDPEPGLVVLDGATPALSRRAQAAYVAASTFRLRRDTNGEAAAFARLCDGEVDVVDSARAITAGEWSRCRTRGLDVVQLQVAVGAGGGAGPGADAPRLLLTTTTRSVGRPEVADYLTFHLRNAPAFAAAVGARSVPAARLREQLGWISSRTYPVFASVAGGPVEQQPRADVDPGATVPPPPLETPAS